MMIYTPYMNIGPIFLQLLILVPIYSIASRGVVLAYQTLWLKQKAMLPKPLHRHCKRRFILFILKNIYFLTSFSFSHSPPLLFCQYALCAFHVCVFCFFLMYGILSGCSIVAFITAGRKTFTGEKCECSSSKENGGTPEKLITGNFSVCFWHFSSMILKACCLEGLLTLFVCIITKLMKKFMWFLEDIFEWTGIFGST